MGQFLSRNSGSGNSGGGAGSGGGNGGNPGSGGGNNTPTPSSNQNSSGQGCGLIIAVLVFILVVVPLLGILFSPSGSTDTSTVRQPLDSSEVTQTAYYTDADGDWIHSSSKLEKGLKAFYKKTGVQPYVYILPNGTTTSTQDLADQASSFYTQLFSDQGHFLLVFCDDGNGHFNCGYYVGASAKSVMDSAAIDILSQNLDYYYDKADSEEEVFSQAFEQTASEIMSSGSKNGEVTPGMRIGAGAILFLIVGGCVFYFVRKKRALQKQQDQAAMERILSTPLEKFGDKDVEELAKKYEDESEQKPTDSQKAKGDKKVESGQESASAQVTESGQKAK